MKLAGFWFSVGGALVWLGFSHTLFSLSHGHKTNVHNYEMHLSQQPSRGTTPGLSEVPRP